MEPAENSEKLNQENHEASIHNKKPVVVVVYCPSFPFDLN